MQYKIASFKVFSANVIGNLVSSGYIFCKGRIYFLLQFMAHKIVMATQSQLVRKRCSFIWDYKKCDLRPYNFRSGAHFLFIPNTYHLRAKGK